VCGCLWQAKTADYLLFSCDTFGSVWSFVLQWLGLSFSVLTDGWVTAIYTSVSSVNLASLCLGKLK